MDVTNCASLVNYSLCSIFLIFGLFYPSEYVILYYVTYLELFITFELFILTTSVIMMIIGKLFGQRIQPNKQWKFSVIIYEIIETAKCVLIVSGLTTFPLMRSRMGYSIALTHDFMEATEIFNNVFLKYLYLTIKTIIIWIAADAWTYFKHYNLHKNKKYLWQFHKQHHSFSNPTSFASFAISPLEALWTFAPIILFAFPSFPFINKMYAPLQLGLILAFIILNIYLHCGYTLYYIEITVPYVYLNTSAHHNIHHEKTNTNLGEVSPFWDFVFGTYHRQRYLQNKKKFGWKFVDFSSRHAPFTK
eukprot:547708_1